MQEFTAKIKNITKGLAPIKLPRNTGFLLECLNLKPTAGEKLVSLESISFPPFEDTFDTDAAPVARNDYFYIYQDETASGNVLENDYDWNAEELTVVAVDGNTESVGVWLDLDDGGKVKIDSDGSFQYDPDADFDLDVGVAEVVSIPYTVMAGGVAVVGTAAVRIHGRPEETSGGEDPPPTPVDADFLLAPVITDTEIHTETGHFIEPGVGVDLVEGVIVFAGGSADLLYVGESGSEFTYLVDGSTDWTLEFIIAPDSYNNKMVYALEAYPNVFLRLKEVGDTFYLQYIYEKDPEMLLYDGYLVYAAAFSESLYPKPESGNIHIALVFDVASGDIAAYIQGDYFGKFTKGAGTYATTSNYFNIGGQPFGVGNYDGSMKGFRITKEKLYSGTTNGSFTPPTEF